MHDLLKLVISKTSDNWNQSSNAKKVLFEKLLGALSSQEIFSNQRYVR